MTFGSASRAMGLGVALALAPAGVRAEWIADQVKVELRTGPGERHRILRVLESGERVQKLADADGWTQVRATDGAEGWVPDRFVTTIQPAAQRAGRLEQELEAARGRVTELQRQLASRGDPQPELERLRARIAELEAEPPGAPAGPSAWSWSTSPWQTLAMGALIMLLGMAIGVVLPRGSVRARKIKF